MKRLAGQLQGKQLQLPPVDPAHAIAGVIILGLIVMNGGDSLRKMQQNRAANSAIIEANQEVERQAMLDTASVERQNEIAVKRYQDGCQMVFTSDRTSFVALQVGRPVLDPVTNYPLPNRMVICDHLGNTGVIINGVIDSVAFATNRDVIEQAIARYRTATSDPSHNNPAQ